MVDDGSAPLPAGEPSAVEREALASGDETTLAITISRRYYFQEQSKVTIGKALGLSRFQVARLLQEARRDGLVRIEIGRPGRVDADLSARLRDELGIDRAVVIESAGGGVDQLGRALAGTLAEESTEASVVGLTWSRALVSMARHIRRLSAHSVLQLAGALYPPDGVPGSVEVVRTVAAAAGGAAAHPIYAPLVVSDVDTAEGLRRQPEIAAAMERFRQLDIALISVGAWQPGGSAVYDLLTPAEQQRLADAGACGELSGRVFDRDGKPVPSDLDDRVVGIDSQTLRAVPKLITSSYGAHRAQATRAAVATGCVHTLVADDELARALLSGA
ncbi:sugar-binding transcriptional regulator [Prauserella flavalba]|uniref:sugar-binding transcriptional regulator n=1 Tax=Prauserella flavalba TaxID=1477506 RepID=UPI00143DDE82|nr:sugar-binding domain-containing protein [Prauserella flavalba]